MRVLAYLYSPRFVKAVADAVLEGKAERGEVPVADEFVDVEEAPTDATDSAEADA